MTPAERADVESITFGGYGSTTTHVRGYQNYNITDQSVVALKNPTNERSWTDTHAKAEFFQSVYHNVDPGSYADFGSNLGYYVFWSAQRGVPSLGIDYNAEYVHVCNAVAARHGITNAQFMHSNLQQWCKTTDTVDLLTVFNVIHHLYDRTEQYRDMHKLLADLASKANAILFEFPTEKDNKGYKWTQHSDYSEQLFVSTCHDIFKSVQRFDGQTEQRPYYLVWV